MTTTVGPRVENGRLGTDSAAADYAFAIAVISIVSIISTLLETRAVSSETCAQR